MLKIKNYHFRYIKTVLYGLVALSLIVMLIVLAVNNVAGIFFAKDLWEEMRFVPREKSETTNKEKKVIDIENKNKQHEYDNYGNIIVDLSIRDDVDFLSPYSLYLTKSKRPSL